MRFILLSFRMLALTVLGYLGTPWAAAAQGNGLPPSEDAISPEAVVSMEKMVIQGGAKFKWRYAKSDHFEIICHTSDTSWLREVIQKAELIIRLLAEKCPFYRFNSDLPIKVIYVDGSGLGRFDKETRNRSKETNEINRRLGRFGQDDMHRPFPVWTSFRSTNEQMILLTPIHYDYYYDEERRLEYYTSTLLAYYTRQILKLKGIDRLSSYARTMHYARSVSHPAFMYFSQHARAYDRRNDIGGFGAHGFRIQGSRIYLCRYSDAVAADTISISPDYKNKAKPTARQIAEQFFKSPSLNLKDVLETPLSLAVPEKSPSAKERADYMMHMRELIDFSDYCVFGPNPKHGEAYAELLMASRKEPINEPIFKKLFGMGYEQFHNEMYSYYRNLAKTKDTVYKDSAWGTPNMLVATFAAKDLPKLVKFQDADRAQSARIISDWFEFNNRPDIARRTLLAAETDAPWVMRNPDFLATLGLSEARHGDKARALALLEKAAALDVVRPEAYRTLSKLLLENILKANGADYKLNTIEIGDVLKPLLVAMKQPQPNPDTYRQTIDLIERAQGEPSKDILEIVGKDCAAFFPDNFDLLEQIVPLLAQYKLQDTASTLLAAAANCVLSDDETKRLERLKHKVP